MPFVILAIEAAEETLRRRVVERERAARDASEAGLAVLAQQRAGAEPLGTDELVLALAIDGNRPPAGPELGELFASSPCRCRSRLTRLHYAALIPSYKQS